MNRTTEAVVALALDVVTPRVLTLAAMASMLGLAAWVMWQPDYYRLAVLALWGVLVSCRSSNSKRNNIKESDHE